MEEQPRLHVFLVQAFEDGRESGLSRRATACDCPIRLQDFHMRAAWLDGFEIGRREAGRRER